MGQEFLYLPGFLRIPVPAKRCHAPTSKLTTLQTPKHAPKHVVYSMQYHLLLQLNLNTKIVRCCCRHLRHSIFVPSPVLPHFLLDIITTVFCLAVAGSSTSRLPSVCTGWLSRRILWLHLYLYLSPLRRASCFSCPPAAKHLPLVVSRCRRLSRCHRLLSAGTPPRLPLVPWLVVVMPLVTSLPPPLVLSKNPLAFETPSPPVCPSFADWLSR